jgi:hypothetical protein
MFNLISNRDRALRMHPMNQLKDLTGAIAPRSDCSCPPYWAEALFDFFTIDSAFISLRALLAGLPEDVLR